MPVLLLFLFNQTGKNSALSTFPKTGIPQKGGGVYPIQLKTNFTWYSAAFSLKNKTSTSYGIIHKI